MKIGGVDARIAICLAVPVVWVVMLATKARLWAPQPRMTSGTAPPFAIIGSIAVTFGTLMIAVACFHPKRSVAIPAGLLGALVAGVYLYLGLRL